MTTKQKGELSEKQWKALKLFEIGGLSRKEIAAQIGWKDDYLNELCAGDIERGGLSADLFKKEYDQIAEKRDENIKALTREGTEAALTNILSSLKKLQEKEKSEELTDNEIKMSGTLLNAISNNAPAVSIKNLSYSYTAGLTAEDLIHEFVKLKSITEASFNRRRVQRTGETGSGEVSPVDEP